MNTADYGLEVVSIYECDKVETTAEWGINGRDGLEQYARTTEGANRTPWT